MSDDRSIGYAMFGVGFGIWWFFNGFNLFRKKQLIDDIPTSTVRGMAMGLVELSGRAGRETVLKGPLSGDDCVAYTYKIERYEQRGKNSEWVTITSGNSFACPFYLEDDTGRVTVVPLGAEFICSVSYSFETGFMNSPTPNLVSFMNNSGITYRSFLGNETLRFTECNIKPKEAVFVLGTAKKTVSALAQDEVHKRKLAQRLNEVKADPKFMAEVDADKDGNVSDDEWQKAVMKVEQDLLQSEITAAASSQLPDVVIGKGDAEKTFIISDKSQKDLDATFGWQSAGGIFGGAALTVACLWYLLMRFHIL